MNRDQLIMFPQSLDEYIGEDNPVRFIDAFVDGLDLRELGFQRAVPDRRRRGHPGRGLCGSRGVAGCHAGHKDQSAGVIASGVD